MPSYKADPGALVHTPNEADVAATGSSSIAQPFIDAGTSYDDIDTDAAAPQQHDTQHGVLSSQAGGSSSYMHSSSSVPAGEASSQKEHSPLHHACGGAAGAQQPSDQPRYDRWDSDAHNVDTNAQSEQQDVGFTAESLDQANGSMTQQEEDQSQAQSSGNHGVPRETGPGLGNLAFQQELQQRSVERQARAGALMSNASAREVSDRGEQGGQAGTVFQRDPRWGHISWLSPGHVDDCCFPDMLHFV